MLLKKFINTEVNWNSKKKIVLIGGGGHCRSVMDSIIQLRQFVEIAVVDKKEPSRFAEYNSTNKTKNGTHVFFAGNDSELSLLYDKGYRNACITIGQIGVSGIRHRIYSVIKDIGFEFPIIIDSDATVGGKTEIGRGVYIGKKSVINSGCKIGEFVIINTGAIVDHDCIIGEFSHIAVGAVLCGEVEIGSNVFVGANATIIQGVKIGEGSVIGAGSIVLQNVPPKSRVVGIWKG